MTNRCFYVDETMQTPNGYVPALVVEGEAGYSPMMGNGELAEPWYWGRDIETAKKLCRDANAEMGVSEDRAREIVESSITAQVRNDGARDAANEKWERIRTGRPVA